MPKRLFAVVVVIVVVVGGTAVAQTVERFSDVPADHPASDAIEWAAEIGLTAGYTDGTFKPEQSLSQSHALVFMERFYDTVLGPGRADGFTRGDMMTLLNAMYDTATINVLHTGCVDSTWRSYSRGSVQSAWLTGMAQIESQCRRWATGAVANPEITVTINEQGHASTGSNGPGAVKMDYYTNAESMQGIAWVHDQILDQHPSLSTHLDSIEYVFHDRETCSGGLPSTACAVNRGPGDYAVVTVTGYFGHLLYYHEIGHTLLFAAAEVDPTLLDHDFEAECINVSHYANHYKQAARPGEELAEYGCFNLDEYTAEAFANAMVGGVTPSLYDACDQRDHRWCDVPPGPHTAGMAWINRLIEVIGS